MRIRDVLFACLAALISMAGLSLAGAESRIGIKTIYLGSGAPVPRPDSMRVTYLVRIPKGRKYKTLGKVEFTQDYDREVAQFFARFERDSMVRDSVFRAVSSQDARELRVDGDSLVRDSILRLPPSPDTKQPDARSAEYAAVDSMVSYWLSSPTPSESHFAKERDRWRIWLRDQMHYEDALNEARRLGGTAFVDESESGGSSFSGTLYGPGGTVLVPGHIEKRRGKSKGKVVVWTP